MLTSIAEWELAVKDSKSGNTFSLNDKCSCVEVEVGFGLHVDGSAFVERTVKQLGLSDVCVCRGRNGS